MAVLRVVEAFTYFVGNVPRVLRAGDLVDEKDPCVKKCPDRFERVEATAERLRGVYDPPVEQATAAPGEKRSVAKPAKD